MSLPFGEPYLSQLRLPSTVGHDPECSVLMIVLLSIEPVFLATAWMIWPTAYASAEPESMPNGVPPYFFRYALMNWVFPGAFEFGNQSPQLKMPVVLARPTLSGNSVGELAPFDRKRSFGLNLSWTMGFTWA